MTSDHAPGAQPAAPSPQKRHADLILAIAERSDPTAFQQLFAAFAPKLKSYLMGLGAAPAVAEDLMQETLLSVWRKARLYDPRKAAASTWIFTIARNLRIDAARRERSALAYAVDVTDEPDAPELPDAVIDGAERGDAVREALKGLTADQAQVVRMSFFQEKPHSEIARELGIPLGTVKSRVRLAMNRLRERLEAHL